MTWLNCNSSEIMKNKLALCGIFHSMNNRCNNVNNSQYKYYGGRGIKCKWTTFIWFYRDMRWWYQKWLSIDRIDNNGHYCKKNCRWADIYTQNNNRRNNVRVPTGQTITEWSREQGFTEHQMQHVAKLYKKWDTLEEILVRYANKKYKKELKALNVRKERKRNSIYKTVWRMKITQNTTAWNLVRKWSFALRASEKLGISIESFQNVYDNGQDTFWGYLWKKV